MWVHINRKWWNRFLWNLIMEYFTKQKFRLFHFQLHGAVLMTTSHEFLHAWAVKPVLCTCEHCVCACSACALSTVLDYSAVSCGMVKRKYLGHQISIFGPQNVWYQYRIMVNMKSLSAESRSISVSHRIWYRYVILLYRFCINSNYTNLNCRGANLS